jgi:hypothetical protein
MTEKHFRLFVNLTVFVRSTMFLIGAIANAVADTPAIMRDVRQLKYARKPLTDAQLSALISAHRGGGCQDKNARCSRTAAWPVTAAMRRMRCSPGPAPDGASFT